MKASSSLWLKRVLVPLWVIQLLAMLVMVAALALALGVQGSYLPAVDLVILIFSAICLILTITEIVLFARAKLAIITYLTMQAVKTGIWAIVFTLVLIGITESNTRIGSISSGLNVVLGGLIQALVTLLSFIATLIYASVVFHRERKSTTPFQFQPHDRLASLATEPVSEINHPSSPSTSELPAYSEHPLIQNPMREQELHELGVREEREVGLMPTSVYREMGGDDAIYELAAQRSVKSGRGSWRDGGAKGSWESRRE